MITGAEINHASKKNIFFCILFIVATMNIFILIPSALKITCNTNSLILSYAFDAANFFFMLLPVVVDLYYIWLSIHIFIYRIVAVVLM